MRISTRRRIVTAITDAVRQWTGSDELQDDMTLLLMRQL
jgi:serine phosphatase RsbU (regulator of sigma subunit)